jgi:hypothetical protein
MSLSSVMMSYFYFLTSFRSSNTSISTDSDLSNCIHVDANESSQLLTVANGNASYLPADDFIRDEQDRNSVSIGTSFFL